MFFTFFFDISLFETWAILVMERYTTEQRVKIIQTFYENGRSKKNTFRALRDYFGAHGRPSELAIFNLAKKFERTGSVLDVQHSVRARSARTIENIVAVRDSVAESPETSVRHRAQELHLTPSTLHRILTKDLNLHAYKVQLTQELKPADHLQRRQYSQWMHEMHAADDHFTRKIIFSDEAHFHLSGFVNKQNCRIWADENPRELVEKPMHPQRVTVWCGFWAGGVIGPFFFENGAGQAVTVTGERYRAMINEFLWPELDAMDVDDMWFQQDGATCHTAHATIEVLREKFNGRIISRNSEHNWPPRSCDLTPLDFFLWGYLKSKVYEGKPETIQELKAAIIATINTVEEQLCQRVIENVDKRNEVCLRSRGEHLADILFHT